MIHMQNPSGKVFFSVTENLEVINKKISTLKKYMRPWLV